MTRRPALWRLFWVMGTAGVVAVASVGMLWGAKSAPEKTPPKAAPKTPAKPAPKAAPALPALPAAGQGIEIISPESGAKLRGVAGVKVAWKDPTGYVIYRVDGQFAYATSSPYEMRWDSSSTTDDEHVLTANAYDSSGVYQGTSSIKVTVENAIPTPSEGVVLKVRFKENDLFTRRFQGRSETGALTASQALPQGFEVLSGNLKSDLSQSVMDTFYEGNAALVRNRVREGYIIVGGLRRNLPEIGQYAMVQISPNGLTLPATAAVTRPRIGLGEVCITLPDPDTRVFPGDQWESPLGAVFDLYTRRAVFVQALHTFEGLRWFRGRECAVITSSYSAVRVPLYDQNPQPVASAAHLAAPAFRTELTQMMGAGRAGRGTGRRGGGATGAGGGRRTAARAATRAPAAASGQQTRTRTGGAVAVDSVRLTDVKGTRRTYLTTVTGRVLHTEDVIMGKVEFRAGAQRVSASGVGGYSVALTGGMMGGGGRGARGMRAGASRAGGQRATAGQPARTTQPGAPTGTELPPSLDYALKLTGDLLVQ